MTSTATTWPAVRLTPEEAGYWGLLAFVAALQVSIAAAHILLAITIAVWLAGLATRAIPVEIPRIFWPLAAYAAWTLVSTFFSVAQHTSFMDSKQIVLFLIVPAVYQLARGPRRASTLILVVITVGALSAAYGIYQYGILKYDFLGKRPQGTMSHYMTYSGLLMLVITAAVGMVLFRTEERTWPTLVLPALLVALAMTFTRSAWIGVGVAVGLLFVLKDVRLLVILPVVAALFIALAPPPVSDRVYSIFDLNDPTNRDRFAMMRAGSAMIRDRPITGMGPDTIRIVYPKYRDASAVEPNNPHLHNVPLQIAAERGLPALAIWLWFIVLLVTQLVQEFRRTRVPALAAIGLAAVAGMLAAGMFEYNFGDSEFLMLFLLLVTLPFAAARPETVPAWRE